LRFCASASRANGADGTINSISGGLSNAPLSSPIESIDLFVRVEEVIDVMWTPPLR